MRSSSGHDGISIRPIPGLMITVINPPLPSDPDPIIISRPPPGEVGNTLKDLDEVGTQQIYYISAIQQLDLQVKSAIDENDLKNIQLRINELRKQCSGFLDFIQQKDELAGERKREEKISPDFRKNCHKFYKSSKDRILDIQKDLAEKDNIQRQLISIEKNKILNQSLDSKLSTTIKDKYDLFSKPQSQRDIRKDVSPIKISPFNPHISKANSIRKAYKNTLKDLDDIRNQQRHYISATQQLDLQVKSAAVDENNLKNIQLHINELRKQCNGFFDFIQQKDKLAGERKREGKISDNFQNSCFQFYESCKNIISHIQEDLSLAEKYIQEQLILIVKKKTSDQSLDSQSTVIDKQAMSVASNGYNLFSEAQNRHNMRKDSDVANLNIRSRL
jgi:hypothetical protein